MHRNMPPCLRETKEPIPSAFLNVHWGGEPHKSLLQGESTQELTRELADQINDIEVWIDWMQHRPHGESESSVHNELWEQITPTRSLEEDFHNTAPLADAMRECATETMADLFSPREGGVEIGRDAGRATRLLFNSFFMQERSLLPLAIAEQNDPLIYAMASRLSQTSARVVQTLSETRLKLPIEKQREQIPDALKGATSEAIVLHHANYNSPESGFIVLPSSAEEDLWDGIDAWCYAASAGLNVVRFPLQIKTKIGSAQSDTASSEDTTPKEPSIPIVYAETPRYGSYRQTQDIINPNENSTIRIEKAAANIQQQLRELAWHHWGKNAA